MPQIRDSAILNTLTDTLMFIIGLIYLSFRGIVLLPKWWRQLSTTGKSWTAFTVSSAAFVIYLLTFINSGYSSATLFEGKTILVWLSENNYQNLTVSFSLNGKETEKLSDIDEDFIHSLDTIPDYVKDKLKNDVTLAREKKTLNMWLSIQYDVPVNVIERLNEIGVKSLASLSKLTDKEIQDAVSDDMLVYSNLLKAKKDTDISDELLKALVHKTPSALLSFVRIILIFFTVILGGTILCVIALLDCLRRFIDNAGVTANHIGMVVNCLGRFIHSASEVGRHQILPQTPSVPHHPDNNRGWLWNWLIGSNVSAQNCIVQWGWDEPQVVGSTMTFLVQINQKNGKPYNISDTAILHVEILHKGEKMSCNKQLDKDCPNVVSVSFTVHRSGVYKICVLIHGKNIKGSPFMKVFEAGAIDANKTGFSNYCSTIVCTAGQSYPLGIETRDCYDNPAKFKSDFQNYFKIKVTDTETDKRYIPTTQIIHNSDSLQLTMHIKMEHEGCYQATVSYGDTKLKNGDFNILVISDEDLEVVNRTTTKKSQNIWYEARLLTDTADSIEKAKRVYVYISPKQLTIKEYFLKIIGKKLHTWRVCPSTKFSFIGYNNRYEAPVMKIYGCSQLPVILATKDRNIIAATFTNFLLRNVGGSETFQDKKIFFLQELRKSAKKGNINLKIDRANVLLSSYRAVKSLYASDWFKTFNIEFINELGLDWGGLRREWIQVLCTELFNPDKSGLFTRFTDNSQGLVHPLHSAGVKLKYYELAGKIVGKCLQDSALGSSTQLLVKAKFSRSFLAQIIGLQVNYKYFETDDPELYKTKIKFIEENSIEDMELTFTEEEYCDGQLVKVVDLIPNGSKIAVANDNKIYYLNSLAQYKLVSCVKDEVEYFLKGLNAIIPDNLLSIFDENELELLMCGTDNYSFTDFKSYTVTSGFVGTKLLEWFWAIVASFTDEQMARLLQFTTGSSQLPPGGFCDLDPKFTISFTSYSTNSLPTAHTCFNQLCLPSYTSMEQMHKCLMTAINEGYQGFGFV